MIEGKRNLIQGLLREYDIQSADDIQEALKDLLSGTLQDMLETEMDNINPQPGKSTWRTENQLEWVGKMNNIRSRAVEIIDVELICV